MIAPCKDCTDRYFICHDSCEKYKVWKQELDIIRERAITNRLNEKRLDECRNDAIKRMHHGKKN